MVKTDRFPHSLYHLVMYKQQVYTDTGEGSGDTELIHVGAVGFNILACKRSDIFYQNDTKTLLRQSVGCFKSTNTFTVM